MLEAAAWLREARALLQERDGELLLAAQRARRSGFVSGAAWMRQAMHQIRHGRIQQANECVVRHSFGVLGLRRYAFASTVAAAVAAIDSPVHSCTSSSRKTTSQRSQVRVEMMSQARSDPASLRTKTK